MDGFGNLFWADKLFEAVVTVDQTKTGLEDVFAGDFMNAVVANGGNFDPAGTRGNGSGLNGLATPGSENDFRISAADLFG